MKKREKIVIPPTEIDLICTFHFAHQHNAERVSFALASASHFVNIRGGNGSAYEVSIYKHHE